MLTSLASSGGRTLMTTWRRRVVSVARNTRLMPPPPSSRSMTYTSPTAVWSLVRKSVESVTRMVVAPPEVGHARDDRQRPQTLAARRQYEHQSAANSALGSARILRTVPNVLALQLHHVAAGRLR